MKILSGDIIDRLTRTFSSLRLAVVLLIVMAVVSVFGTLTPQDQEPAVYIANYGNLGYSLLKFSGLIDLYHSIGFKILTSLLTLNISVCTYRRMKGVIRLTFSPRVEREPGAIRSLRINNTLPEPSQAHVLKRVMSDKGYRVLESGNNIFGDKGRFGLWGDMVSHASILLIIVGAFIGSLGYTATVNVYEDGYVDEVYNWNERKDVPLGIRLIVDRVSLQYYPVQVKVAVRRRSTGEDLGSYEVMEGGEAAVAGTGITLVPEEANFATGGVSLRVFEDGRLKGLYNTSYSDGGPMAPIGMDLLILSEGHGTRMPKSLAATVRLQREGRMLKQGIIMVNDPMSFEGKKIYITAVDSDKNGRTFVGFQITRDPGVPVVWVGFGLLLAGLTLSFTVFHRRVWIHVGDGELVVGGTTNKDIQGFMREYGGMIKSYIQEVSE